MNSRTNIAARLLTATALIGTSCALSWYFVISPLLDVISTAGKLLGKLFAGI